MIAIDGLPAETLVWVEHFHFWDWDQSDPHYHASATELHNCDDSNQASSIAEMRAEQYAENAWLRYAEECWFG